MQVSGAAAVGMLVVASATGCSSPPRSATPAATPAAQPSAPTRAMTQGSAGPAGSAAGAGVDAELVKEGYRVVQRHGETLYCRSQSVTGTKFSTTTCLTARQIQEQKSALQLSKDVLNQSRGIQCMGPECQGK